MKDESDSDDICDNTVFNSDNSYLFEIVYAYTVYGIPIGSKY